MQHRLLPSLRACAASFPREMEDVGTRDCRHVCGGVGSCANRLRLQVNDDLSCAHSIRSCKQVIARRERLRSRPFCANSACAAACSSRQHRPGIQDSLAWDSRNKRENIEMWNRDSGGAGLPLQRLLLERECGSARIRKQVDSWAEKDFLRRSSASYASIQNPRSTIAAAFSPDGSVIASTQ